MTYKKIKINKKKLTLPQSLFFDKVSDFKFAELLFANI